jgi:hypothetical protein
MTHPSQKTPAPIAILSAAKPKRKRRINAVPSDFDLADVFAGDTLTTFDTMPRQNAGLYLMTLFGDPIKRAKCQG